MTTVIIAQFLGVLFLWGTVLYVIENHAVDGFKQALRWGTQLLGLAVSFSLILAQVRWPEEAVFSHLIGPFFLLCLLFTGEVTWVDYWLRKKSISNYAIYMVFFLMLTTLLAFVTMALLASVYPGS